MTLLLLLLLYTLLPLLVDKRFRNQTWKYQPSSLLQRGRECGVVRPQLAYPANLNSTLNRQHTQQQPHGKILHSTIHLHLRNRTIDLRVQRAQHQRRKLETLVSFQVVEDKLLMLQFGFPCYATLHKNAAELHGGGTALQSVYEGQRVFSFVEVFAEAFCFCVLR